MIIYIASDGQARLVSPQHVYQGSSVTDITVIAPFPAQTAMTVAFSLPDGKEFGGVQGSTQTPPYIMTPLANQPELPDGVQAWQYVMQSAITQNAGQAKVSVTAQFAQGSGEAASFTQQTSAQVEFAIEPSVVGTLPDEPTPDAWKQVLAAIGDLDGKILAAQNDISDIENGDTTVGKAKADQKGNVIDETYATKDELLETTGTEVKVNGTTQPEVSFTSDPQTQITANKTAIAEAQSDISDIVSGAQVVGAATKATQDANGNNIAETYATKDELLETTGTEVKVNGTTQPEVSFTSDPQTQITANKTAIAEAQSDISDIVSGAQTVGKAKQDADGNNIAETYATKTGTYSTLIAGGNTVLDTRNVNSPPSYYADQKTCYEFKSRDTLGLRDYMPSSSYVLLTTKKGWEGSYVVYQEAVSAGSDQSSVTDSVKCYRYGLGETWGEWKVILAVDPTKLAPSTANGWTQTTATGTLPSAGVYMVSFDIEEGALVGTGVLFFDGKNIAQAALSVGNLVAATVSYHPDNSPKWLLYAKSLASITAVYYKRIA